MTKKIPAEARSRGPGASHCLPAFTMAAISCPKAFPEGQWAYNSAMPLKPLPLPTLSSVHHLDCDSAHASAGAQRGTTSPFMRGRTAKLSGFGYLSQCGYLGACCTDHISTLISQEELGNYSRKWLFPGHVDWEGRVNPPPSYAAATKDDMGNRQSCCQVAPCCQKIAICSNISPIPPQIQQEI